MSINNLYEYVAGEFQNIERLEQLPTLGPDTVYIKDQNDVKMLCAHIEIYNAESGGVLLVLGTDYELEYYNSEVSQSEGVECYAGYRIINPAYENTNLYITADIYGGYTTRVYRPTYAEASANITVDPSSLDDSIIIDTSLSGITVTLPEGTRKNQRVTVIADGENNVTISCTGPADGTEYAEAGVPFVWASTGWLALGGTGSGSGSGTPIGSAHWTGITSLSPPPGTLWADGSLYNISDYPSLFNKYGTTWGGDGISTFGVPNMQGIHPGSIGTQDINGRTKGDPLAEIGDYKEDHGQIITGSLSAQQVAFAEEIGALRIGAASSSLRAGNGSASTNHINLDSSFSARTGEYTDTSQAMGRWFIIAFDSVEEVPGDPSLIKDYNLVWEGTPAAIVPNEWGEGLFFLAYNYDYDGSTIYGNAFMGVAIDGFDREIVIDVEQAGGDSEVRGRYDFSINSFTIEEFGNGYTNPQIHGIYKWGDVASGSLNPPVDGWETVWEGEAASVPNLWGAGVFSITGETGVALGSGWLEVGDITIDTYSPTFSSASGNHLWYDASTNLFQFTASYNIIRIRKFNSLVNVVHSYQATVKEVDTTAGDVDVSADFLTLAPGKVMTYVNIGTGGNHITGLPDSIAIGNGKALQLTGGTTAWRYEDVIIDEYTTSLGQDVTKWSGGKAILNDYIACDNSLRDIGEAGFVSIRAPMASVMAVAVAGPAAKVGTTYTATGYQVEGFITTTAAINSGIEAEVLIEGRWK